MDSAIRRRCAAQATPWPCTRRWLTVELALFVPIPLLAAAMARGIGLS